MALGVAAFFLAALGLGVEGESDALSNASSSLDVDTVAFFGFAVFVAVVFGVAVFFADPMLKMGARGNSFSLFSSELAGFFLVVLLMGAFLTAGVAALVLPLGAAVFRLYKTQSIQESMHSLAMLPLRQAFHTRRLNHHLIQTHHHRLGNHHPCQNQSRRFENRLQSRSFSK